MCSVAILPSGGDPLLPILIDLTVLIRVQVIDGLTPVRRHERVDAGRHVGRVPEASTSLALGVEFFSRVPKPGIWCLIQGSVSEWVWGTRLITTLQLTNKHMICFHKFEAK